MTFCCVSGCRHQTCRERRCLHSATSQKRHGQHSRAVTDNLPRACAGVALVDAHGGGASADMMPLFEHYLDAAPSAHDEAGYDHVREGVVVLLGTLARHLPPGDAKVRTVQNGSACVDAG